MDDIQKGIGFNSTQTYTGLLGETALLSTQQKLILDLPTTLADFFEYLSSCNEMAVEQLEEYGEGQDEEEAYSSPLLATKTLMSFLTVSDIMHLRMVCKSTSQIATPEIQIKAIQAGNLDDSIRINYWVTKTPFFEVVNELKRKYPPQSVFTNVFEEI